MRVVFHIDELNKWPLVLANVTTFLSVEAQATVEVVESSPRCWCKFPLPVCPCLSHPVLFAPSLNAG